MRIFSVWTQQFHCQKVLLNLMAWNCDYFHQFPPFFTTLQSPNAIKMCKSLVVLLVFWRYIFFHVRITSNEIFIPTFFNITSGLNSTAVIKKDRIYKYITQLPDSFIYRQQTSSACTSSNFSGDSSYADYPIRSYS